MNLNYNSVIARMYRYFWANEDNMPDNLCPFFWKLLIALVLFIPFIICSLPILITERAVKDDSNFNPFVRVICGLFIYGLLWFVGFIFLCFYHLIRYWLNCYSYSSDYATFGGIFGLAGIVIFLIFFIKSKMSYYETPEIFEITREFISAKYNKYCPQIKWKK